MVVALSQLIKYSYKFISMSNYRSIWCSLLFLRNGNTLIYCLHRVFAQGKIMNKFCSGLQGIKQWCHLSGSESFFSKNYHPWYDSEHKTTNWYQANAWHAVRGFCYSDISLDTCRLCFLEELNKNKMDRDRAQQSTHQIRLLISFPALFLAVWVDSTQAHAVICMTEAC